MHAYYNESEIMVPTWLLLILVVLLPVVQTCLTVSFSGEPIRLRVLDVHNFCLALLASMCTQMAVTLIIKNAVGKPRPDLIARCVPYQYPLARPGELSNVVICSTEDIELLWDGFRSFPSSHSAASFASASLQFLYNARKFNILGGSAFSLKVMTTLSPIFTAMYISSTRVSDNRHFISDVIAGALIGAFSGCLFYLVYFPYPLRCTDRDMVDCTPGDTLIMRYRSPPNPEVGASCQTPVHDLIVETICESPANVNV